MGFAQCARDNSSSKFLFKDMKILLTTTKEIAIRLIEKWVSVQTAVHHTYSVLILINAIGVEKLPVRNVCQSGQTLLKLKSTLESKGYPAIYETINFCSISCSEIFWQIVKNYSLTDIGTDIPNFGRNLRNLFCIAIHHALCIEPYHRTDAINMVRWAIDHDTGDYVAIPFGLLDDGTIRPECWDITPEFVKLGYSALALNLEKCGRTLDAAKIYEEKLKIYDKARLLRQNEKQTIVKHTDVSVNLNELLKQVKDGGIVAIYRCPHCNGTLKVNDKTSLKSLKICAHCGSEIETVDLADFLKTALT